MAGSIHRACQNYNSFRELFHWAVIEFETASGVTNLPVYKKGGYYATKFISNNIFLQSTDQSFYAVVQSCNPNKHDEDGHLVERWKKEYYVEEVMNVLVPKLRCMSVDAFKESCFVVEDKPGFLLGWKIK